MNFYRTTEPSNRPQWLQLIHQKKAYDFGLLHTSLERIENTSGHPLPMHTHDVYHIVLYLAGESALMLDGAHVPFKPGTLVLTGPGQAHHFYSTLPGKFAYREVTFAFEHADGDLALPFHTMLSILTGATLPNCGSVFHLSAAEARECDHRMDRVGICFQTIHPLMWCDAHMAVGELFHFIIQNIYAAHMRATPCPMNPLDEVHNYIIQHFREPLSIGRLASMAHMSAGYFQRAFRNAYGIAPIAYQIELRLLAAQTLLRTTSVPVGEIATRLGFTSCYYFSRTFSKSIGLSPRMFRQQHQKTATPDGTNQQES